MMREYILCYRDRVFGGIYDDRLLVKAVPSAVRICPWSLRMIRKRWSRDTIAFVTEDSESDSILFDTWLSLKLQWVIPLSESRKQNSSLCLPWRTGRCFSLRWRKGLLTTLWFEGELLNWQMRTSHLISKSKPFWRIILCLKSNYELLEGAIYAGEKDAQVSLRHI